MAGQQDDLDLLNAVTDLDDPRFDAADRAWGEADGAEGDLDAILARYIRAHRPSFFTP